MARERIGLIGPGRMGLAMVKHLVKSGYTVTVTDIDKRRMEAAAKEGAAMAPNSAALGATADFVIVAVGYDDETREVTTGKHGLIDAMAITRASIPLAASSSAAAMAIPTSMPQAMIATSLPSRTTAPLPISNW